MNPVERLRTKRPNKAGDQLGDQQKWLHHDARATLERLQQKHENLKEELENAYGYAVFPALGRASLVLGATHGKGAVFQKGKCIGFASLTQITIGVQLGGQTISELVFFHDEEAFERFKGGKAAFVGNVSAGIVKAAAAGTTNPAPFTAHAYSRGGMVLELSLGGQKLSFIPPGGKKEEGTSESEGKARRGRRRRDEKSEGANGRRFGRHGEEAEGKRHGLHRFGRRADADEDDAGLQRESMRPSPAVAAGLSALALMATRAIKAQVESRPGPLD